MLVKKADTKSKISLVNQHLGPGLACCLLTFVLFILSVTQIVVAEAPKIKVGVSSALTGPAAAYGLDIKDAVLFAAENLKLDNFEFFFEDDRCTGKDAATIANKFVNVLAVDFVVGYACSSTALAAAPIYEKAKTPVIVSCGSSPRISEAGDYIFRTTPSDLLAAKKLYAYVASRHKVFGIISEEDEYPQSLQKAIVEANSDREVKLLIENYLPSTQDFKTQLLKLKTQNVEGVFINSQTESSSVTILKQIREMHWNLPIYGAYWPASPSYLKLAGSDAEGIVFVDTPPLSALLNQEGRQVYQKFLSKYPKIRSIESVWASTYEAIRLIQKATMQKEDFRKFLYTSKFKGLFGEYSFNQNGDIQGFDFVMKKIENGNPVLLKG